MATRHNFTIEFFGSRKFLFMSNDFELWVIKLLKVALALKLRIAHVKCAAKLANSANLHVYFERLDALLAVSPPHFDDSMRVT